ncbi:hypothetical protein [Rhodovarius sp.]
MGEAYTEDNSANAASVVRNMVHLPSACSGQAILRLVLDRLPRLVI